MCFVSLLDERTTLETTPSTMTAEPNPSRLDVMMGILSVLLVGGFFIDLWAHSHGRVDDSFFTPWHGLLYASAGLFGGVLLGIALRARRAVGRDPAISCLTVTACL